MSYGITNHKYVEASYLLNNLRRFLSENIVDAVAARSVAHRIDNLQSFLDYLNDESMGGGV